MKNEFPKRVVTLNPILVSGKFMITSRPVLRSRTLLVIVLCFVKPSSHHQHDATVLLSCVEVLTCRAVCLEFATS